MVVSVSLAIGCNWLVHDRPAYHNIQAEITSIVKSGDTSVLVHIEVLDGGNADVCNLMLYFDTVVVQRGPRLGTKFVASNVSDCQLNKSYTVTASPMRKGQEYFFQLFQEASWSISGPRSHRDLFIGAQKKFIML